MNYLQLTNDFLIETGMDDQITTVESLTDDPLKASVWIRDAWLEIQRSRTDWTFRWAEGSFNTVIAQREYLLSSIGRTIGDRFSFDTFVIAAEKARITQTDHRNFIFASDAGLPGYIYQKPTGTLGLYAVPDAIYQVDYEYYAAPVTLAANTDAPTLDTAYHKAIVWLAVRNYAREQGNEWAGLYQAASMEFTNILNDMIIHFLAPYEGKRGI